MYKTCFLHIGPPKTGTSSIQQTLWHNRDFLIENGIFYPSQEKNHRFITSCFMEKPENFDYNKFYTDDIQEVAVLNKSRLNIFENEMSSFSSCDTLVLSSEHIVLLNAREISKLKDYLYKFCEQVKVVAYLRHPLSSVSSFTQEAVKNGARSLDDIRKKPGFTQFSVLLPKWEECFRKEDVILRVMHKPALKNNDLIDDFLNVINFSGDFDEIARIKANESLSAPAVLIADALTRFAPKFSQNRAKAQYLFDIKGPSYKADKVILERTIELAEPQLKYLEDNWGITLPKPKNIEPDDVVFNDEAVESIAELLNSLAFTKAKEKNEKI